MLNIIYYVNSQNKDSPIKKDSIKAKIKALIIHVAQNNGQTSYMVAKNIRGYHFSEIRIKFSKNLYRILYFIWQDDNLILLHIFLINLLVVNLIENRYKDFIKNTKFYE